MSWAKTLVDFAHSQVNDQVRELLWARGVSDAQIDHFQFGYLDRNLPELVGVGVDAFLKWSHRGTKVTNSYVLPLTNTLGEIKGLQFRSIEEEKKGYSDFFLDETEAISFGLGQAAPHIWQSETVFLVEGAFDLPPVQRVFPDTVALLSARVGGPMLRCLQRTVRKIVLIYDMDSTGRRLSDKFAFEHKDEFEIKNLSYPRVMLANGKLSKDPAELWSAWGDEQFAKYFRTLV